MCNSRGAWFLVVFIMGCGSSNFSGSDELTASNKVAVSGAEATGKELTETFKSEMVSGKADIAWFVDQSGSMQAETQHVQNNLAQFFELMKQQVDARYALVASSSGKHSISIPSPDANRVQVDYPVASTNALEIAISTFIPADAKATPSLSKSSPDQGSVKSFPIQGALHSFFRPDALPVVVVVTDDNAERVTENNFLELAQSALGRTPRLYAWRASNQLPEIPGASCDVANDGTAYEKLAQKTGGEVFNICEPDWRGSFSKLTTNIAAAAKNSFSLSKDPKAILAITVDGRNIDLSKLILKGKVVTLPAGELQAGQKSTVVVRYRP